MSKPIRTVSVIGDGAMGTLCSLLLVEQGVKVTLWSAFPEQAADLLRDKENKRFLPGFQIPESVRIVSDDSTAFDKADLAVSAVPCQHVRTVWSRLAQYYPAGVPIVTVAKGIEIGTLKLPTNIISDCVGDAPLVALSGPCISSEVAAKKPATVVAGAKEVEHAEAVQNTFSTPYFRVYTSEDVVGLELAGAVKNVIALAAGICDGLDAGCNAKASLLTRGLVEIARLGSAMGASPDTFNGLAGVGDLVTTCISPASRNRTAGERIGKGEPAQDVIESTVSVIEGIPTTKSVLKIAEDHNVEMPIVSAVASVLFGGVTPADAIHALMTRRLCPER